MVAMKVQLMVDDLGVDLDHEDLADLCWRLGSREDAAEMLGRLAGHASEAVQEAVATSDCLPRDAHRVLAASPSDKVASAALLSDRALELSADVLRRLASRPSDVALGVVNLLQRLPAEVRESIVPQLQAHPDPAVRKMLVAELEILELIDSDEGDDDMDFPD